jgi:protein-disulfide isomerase
MSSRVDRKQANRMVREQLARERARARRLWVTIGAVAVLVIAGLAGWAVYSSQRSSSYVAPAHSTAGDDGLVVGSGGKTVEVYLDFMCPHCKEFEDSSGDTLNQMVTGGKIKLVYHPLAFLDSASTTQYSTRSAAAAGCASDAGKLTEYVKVMYANQPAEGSAGLSDDEIIRLAGTAGISDAGFATCVHSGKYKPWVQHVTDKATARGVNGTPTVYVDGKQVDATLAAVTAAVGA